MRYAFINRINNAVIGVYDGETPHDAAEPFILGLEGVRGFVIEPLPLDDETNRGYAAYSVPEGFESWDSPFLVSGCALATVFTLGEQIGAEGEAHSAGVRLDAAALDRLYTDCAVGLFMQLWTAADSEGELDPIDVPPLAMRAVDAAQALRHEQEQRQSG